MGDLQTEQGDSLELRYVPVSEFTRVVNAKGTAAQKTAAFAALARINTLYMIEGAWSGHIGTSFSSIEIMSWLFLNELRDLDKGADDCDIFFSSKGHDAPALYSVLIGLGLLPADKLHQLRRFLDTFSGGLDAERLCQLGDRADDRVGAFAGQQVLDEAAVDLQFVEREALKIAERRIAGPEVVERHAYAERTQRMQQL